MSSSTTLLVLGRRSDRSTGLPGADHHHLHNNTFFQFDMSLNKIVRIKERWKLNFQAEALNFLNHPFFPLANTSPTATNFGEITTASGTRTVQLRGSVEW